MKQRRGEEDKQIPEDTDEMVQSEVICKNVDFKLDYHITFKAFLCFTLYRVHVRAVKNIKEL